MEEFNISDFDWPEKYVTDAGVATSIVDGISESHSEYWKMIEKTEDHINGKKPKDPAKLKDQAMSWTNNWNYGKARAKIERGVSENVKGVNDALSMATVSFRAYNDEKDKEDAEMQFLQSQEMRGIISTKIASTFIETLDRETRLTGFLNKVEYNSYAFGWSAVTKDRNRDWMGTAHHVRDIGFKGKTKPDEIKMFSIFDNMDGDELWRLWKTYKKAQFLKREEDTDGNVYHIPHTGGWVLEGIEEALFYAYNGQFIKNGKDGSKPNVHFTSFQNILPEFVKKPSLVIENTEKVSISRIYNFELDGSFTVSYVAYGNNWSYGKNGCRATCCTGGSNKDSNSTGMSPKFLLYQKSFGKLSQDEAIIIIQDSGFSVDGNIQDMRGVAKYAIEDSIRYNRKKNSIEDKLLFSGSAYFRQGTAQDGETMRITPSQGFVLVNEGFVMIEKQPDFNLQNHIMSLQMDERDHERDTIQYDPKIGSRLTSRPNKDEVRIKEQEVRKISGSKSDIKIRCYRKLFGNMLSSITYAIKNGTKHMDKAAQMGVTYFKDELMEELKDLLNIKSEKQLLNVLNSINDFSLEPVLMDTQAIKEMMALSETPYAKRRLQRMLFLASGLPRKELNRLFPVITDDMRTFGDERVAAIENDMFWTTREIVYTDRDDPITHLSIHFNKVATVFDQVKGGAIDPMKGFNYIASMLEHCLFHIDKVAKNPYYSKYYDQYKAIYDRFTKALNSLKGEVEKMAKQIQKQQSEQQGQGGQQQQQIDPQVQAKIEMDWYKTKAGIEISKIRSDFRAKEKEKDADFKRSIQAQNNEFKMGLQREQAELAKETQLIQESVKLGQLLSKQQTTGQ